MITDFAKVAEAYGAKAYRASTIQELEEAIRQSRNEKVATLIDIKVLPKTMTADYKSWWNVGIASTSKRKEVKDAFERKELQRKKARAY